jgi:hypothetical protein
MKLGYALIGKREKEEGEGVDFDGVGGMEGLEGAEAITQRSTESRIRLVSWRSLHGRFTFVCHQKEPLPGESENSTVPPQTYPTAMITLLSRCFALILLLATTLYAQVPQLINYQGRVVVDGVNFDGVGQFKFALVNAGGTTTYWSNDGSSAAGIEPAAAVILPVSKGLYSVLLGDATLNNMTIVPATVFVNGDVHLRVWFNDGVTGFQQLTPDRRIAAVGYAMMAESVVDGAITTAKIADGAVTAEKLAAGVVQSVNIATGAVGNAQLATGLTLGGLTTGTFSGSLSGNVSGSAASFTGALIGDVTGTQGATAIAGGAVTTAKIANGAVNSTKLASDLTLGGTTAGTFVGRVTLAAGSASAAPLLMQAGTILTTPTLGAFEFDGTKVFVTNNSASPTRKTFAFTDSMISSSQIAPASLNGSHLEPGIVLTAPVFGTIINSGTLTLPTTTDVLIGRATSDVLTNKSITGNTNVVAASQLRTTSGDVVISGANPPSIGQVLTATTPTQARWQDLPNSGIDCQSAIANSVSVGSTSYTTLLSLTTHDMGENGCYMISFSATSRSAGGGHD